MTHRARAVAWILLFFTGMLFLLVALLLPREDGDDRVALWVALYALPLAATVASMWIRPGVARRAWIPTAITLACLAAWLVVLTSP